MKKSLFSLVLLSFLATALLAEVVELKILGTTDIHTRIMREPNESGSWYQLGGFIIDEREQAGADKTLLIDSGDVIQGEMIGAVSNGEAGLIPLRNLKYDVWVPGNHEFDFGSKRFFTLAEPFRDLILCCNVCQVGGKAYTPWKIFERGGARIAVIGGTSSYMGQWMTDEHRKLCHITMLQDELKKILPEILEEKPDAIILACHQGWVEKDPRHVNEVKEIAELFPEIDLILGGHTHRFFKGQVIGKRTWYVQAGCHGRALAIINLKVDTDKHSVVEIKSHLRNVRKPDRGCSLVIQGLDGWLRKTEKLALEQFTPKLPESIICEGRPGINCQASELFCLSMVKASGAQVAFHGTLSDKILPAGKAVNGKDLFDFVPFENTIYTAELTVEQLEAILKEQWQQRDLYTYSGIYGAKATITDNKIVKITSIAGEPPVPGKRYLTAFNSYSIASCEGNYPVLERLVELPEAKLTNTGIASRDAVRDYLKSRRDWPIVAHPWISLQ